MRIELLGSATKEQLEKRIQMVALAGKLSRFDGNVFDVLENTNEYEKNVKLIKRIISMGHESITDHDYLVFAIEGVSPVIEQTIIEERISSFTIKSRREVNFAKVGYYVPIFKDAKQKPLANQEEIEKIYCNHMNFLFDSYQKLVDKGVPIEDARFVLPYSYHSNIIMGVDAHVLKNMINEFTKGVKSNISEIHEFGNHLYHIVCEQVPYYKDIIDDIEPHTVDRVRTCLDSVIDDKEYRVLEKPIVVTHSNRVDDMIILSSLMNKYQFPYEQAKKVYLEKIKPDTELCQQIMKEIYNSTQKELSQVSFSFQIPVSLAVLTHITRHRTHLPMIPDFVPIHNLKQYKTPKTIATRCLEFYHEIYDQNYQVYLSLKEMGVREDDLIYFHLSGNTVNITTNMDGKTLAWITRLRTCNKAQWEIREIFNEIRKLVKEIAPIYGSILGPDCETRYFCGEGKESCGKIKQLEKRKNICVES